jgi:hypothetical protein
LTHRRNQCGSFASGPPRCTRSALVAELASPSKPRWRSGQLCAKRLSADSVLPVYPGGEVGVVCGGARRCQVRRLHRARCPTDLAASPVRHNGLSSQDWWSARVVRLWARSSHHPPTWPICVPVSKPATGMTRVVHYSCLWSALRGRHRVPCLHTSAYYSTCVESADTSSTSRTFSDMTPQVHLYDTAGFATTPIGGASSAGCKTAGVQTGRPLLVRTPQQKRNLNQKLPGGGGSIMAEPSLTALLQERASRQPRRHGVHVHRR